MIKEQLRMFMEMDPQIDDTEDDDLSAFYEQRQRRSLAAEHLVCADLLFKKDIDAYLVQTGRPYDVIAELDGRILRVQVKSCMKPRIVNGSMRYAFGGNKGKTARTNPEGMRRYKNLCEIIACAAMDIGKIKYLASASIDTGIVTFSAKQFAYSQDDGWSQSLLVIGG